MGPREPRLHHHAPGAMRRLQRRARPRGMRKRIRLYRKYLARGGLSHGLECLLKRRFEPATIMIFNGRHRKHRQIIRDANAARDSKEYRQAALLYEEALHL